MDPARLLARMSIEEKIAQLGGVWMNVLVSKDGEFRADRATAALGHGTGHVTRIGGGSALPPERVAELTNEIQRYLTEQTRLGIPAIVHEEAVAGLSARGATQFPHAIGQAATFDPALVEDMGRVIRSQMRAIGATQALSPLFDVARDPRWGRTEETYGEDPYLVARMGVAFVRGLQGEDLATGVAATGKHFVGYSLPEGGRNHGPVQLGPRELREVFAAPFRAAIHEAGLACMMNSYSSLDGVPCGASPEIMDDLLRGELGFDGCVVSDYFTLGLLVSFHAVATGPADAAAQALRAGIDVELPALDAYRELTPEHEELIDRSVLRVLRLKERLGLFERPFAVYAPVFDTGEQRALARTMAERSIVLVHNDAGLLPLDPTARIAVIGEFADDHRVLFGDYSYPAHQEVLFSMQAPVPGAADPDALWQACVPAVSIAQAVRERAPGVTGDPSRADMAVAVLGGRSGLLRESVSGEFRDSASLALPDESLPSIPTVAVVIGGRVPALPGAAERAGALVFAWLPGEEGGHAVAAALFGDVNPSGRLPVSLPRAAGQVPVHYNHRSGGMRSQFYGDYVDVPASPLYPFGHGLSYTTFGYADLSVTTDIRVECTVTNTGEVAGAEVVQLYLRDEVASVARPAKQLAGFLRVHLEPGRSARVRFDVDPAQLAFYDRAMRFVVEPGALRVMVGASSADIRLEATIDVEGRTADPNALRPTSAAQTLL